jgi:hypothetical protein
MNSSRPIINKKKETERLIQKLISEEFRFLHYNSSKHTLSFRSDLPLNKLQEIATKLQLLGLNIKAVAGIPNVFSTFDTPARIEINNSYDNMIKYLTEATLRSDNIDCPVDTSRLDAINNIREEIAAALTPKCK